MKPTIGITQEESLLQGIRLPEMYHIRQRFDCEKVSSISSIIDREIKKALDLKLIQPGMNLAIAVGSRGVNNIAEIVRSIVKCLKKEEVSSYIIPAMGSHGGATVSGQIEILHSYGITEEYIQAPIRVTVDALKIGETGSGEPVYLDAEAAKSDGIIIVNRIKPHTAFSGSIESGLLKMAVVGLGKQLGAQSFHSGGMESMAQNLLEMGKVVIDFGKIPFGIAIIENAFDETADIMLVPSREIISKEPELLIRAKESMPELPLKDIDVLIIEEIGKDISGDSMDPNITGRFYSSSVFRENTPNVQRIVCLDITKASHGNCIGVGVSDFITRKLYENIDFSPMYINALTNCVLEPAKVPLVMANEELAIKAAISSCLNIDKSKPKIVRIKNTLSLENIQVSKAVLDEIVGNENIEVLG